MPPTLLVAVVVHVAAAAVFGLLGAALAGRSTREEAALANTMFATWWFSIGLQQLTNAARIVLVQLDAPLSLLISLQFASLAALTMGLAGLLYYLVYLYTGRSVVLWPLLLFYALYAGWAIQFVARQQPTGMEVGRWTVGYVYAQPSDPSATLLAVLALAGPQLLAVAGLIVLAFRLPVSASRVRVVVVALGILVWFGSAILGVVAGLSGDAWRVLTLLLPILVGLAVLSVYRPPGWLRSHMPPEIPRFDESEATPA